MRCSCRRMIRVRRARLECAIKRKHCQCKRRLIGTHVPFPAVPSLSVRVTITSRNSASNLRNGILSSENTLRIRSPQNSKLAPRKSKSNFDFGTDGENERLGFRVAVVRPGIIAFRRPTVDTTNAWLCLGSLPQFSEGYVKMKLFCSADHVHVVLNVCVWGGALQRERVCGVGVKGNVGRRTTSPTHNSR